MFFRQDGFTLAEALIATVVMSMIILGAVSMDFASNRWLVLDSEKAKVQDEAKIAMEHIVKYVQQGIGYINNPGITISGGGSRLLVNLDLNRDGRFSGVNGGDGTIQYEIDAANNTIVVTEDPGDQERLAENIVQGSSFALAPGSPNQVVVDITARSKPGEAVGPQNPQTSLSSTVVARGMSSN